MPKHRQRHSKKSFNSPCTQRARCLFQPRPCQVHARTHRPYRFGQEVKRVCEYKQRQRLIRQLIKPIRHPVRSTQHDQTQRKRQRRSCVSNERQPFENERSLGWKTRSHHRNGNRQQRGQERGRNAPLHALAQGFPYIADDAWLIESAQPVDDGAGGHDDADKKDNRKQHEDRNMPESQAE